MESGSYPHRLVANLADYNSRPIRVKVLPLCNLKSYVRLEEATSFAFQLRMYQICHIVSNLSMVNRSSGHSIHTAIYVLIFHILAGAVYLQVLFRCNEMLAF